MTPASQGLKALFLTSIRFRLSGSGSSNAIYHASGKQFAARAVLSPARSWTCRQCQTTSRGSLNRSLERPHIAVNTLSRSFTSSGRKAADTAPPPGTSSATPEARTLPETNHEKLPSHSQSRRSDVSKRLQTFMDGMLAKAAVAGQRVNIYTGTDYSGIESLRQQIVDQEQEVKARHNLVSTARDAHAIAHAEQAASQKEVVSLLERKTSWSPSDLDRYTSLIRSEHLHEQSVASARQALAAAEKNLEEARTELERKERKQYHEEQIWSDTIRRNSTWVTFGLMGLNILLLIANIGIVEPWRRSRLVREVKDALDKKTLTSGALLTDQASSSAEPSLIQVEATSQEVEAIAPKDQKVPAAAGAAVPKSSNGEVVAEPGNAALTIEVASAKTDFSVHSAASRVTTSLQQAWARTVEVFREWSQSPLSHDQLALTKIEVTTLAVESVVFGVAIMSCLASLLRDH